jgi:hypothetical protein
MHQYEENGMKLGLLWSLVLAVSIAAGGALADDKAEHKCGSSCGSSCAKTCSAEGQAKAKCPVSGGDISKDASVDYKGGKVYLCCAGCTGKFEKEKDKLAAKANLQLVLTGQAKQVGCPLSGGKVNSEAKAKVCGVEVGFCCKNCCGKVAKAKPAEQCELVFGKNFDKAFKVAKEEK